MTSRRPLVAVLSLLFPAMIVIFAACSDEAEGERCDTRNTRNGSDDCQPGLVCVPGGDLGSGSTAYCLDAPYCGVCCPVDRTTATTSVCQLSSTLAGADAAVPVTDAGDAAADASDAADANETDADAASTDASDADTSDAADAADASSDGPG